MLSDGGQALVALVFMAMLFGAAKAVAQKVLLPILGLLVVFMVADHYLPELALMQKASDALAYVEAQIPQDLWNVVSTKINSVAEWLMNTFGSLKGEQSD